MRGIQLAEQVRGIIIPGDISHSKGLLVNFLGVHLQFWLSVAIVLKLSPDLKSLLEIGTVETLAEQVPLVVHLRNFVVKVTLSLLLNLGESLLGFFSLLLQVFDLIENLLLGKNTSESGRGWLRTSSKDVTLRVNSVLIEFALLTKEISGLIVEMRLWLILFFFSSLFLDKFWLLWHHILINYLLIHGVLNLFSITIDIDNIKDM